MKKAIVSTALSLALTALCGGFAHAAPTPTALPEGSYEGRGAFTHEEGTDGNYSVAVDLKNNRILSKYKWTMPDGSEKQSEFAFDAVFDKGGFFMVFVNGINGPVGRGYCRPYQCHYDIKIGEFELEETMTTYEGKLYRIGSKLQDGKRVSWQEALQPKAD